MNSSAEVVAKATRILAEIEYHIDKDDCQHCQALLKSAVAGNHSSTEPVPQPVTPDANQRLRVFYHEK